MKIDLSFLTNLKSGVEIQNLTSGKTNVDSASRLDYRVKNEMNGNIIEEIREDFGTLIRTQETLVSSLDLANKVFSSMNSIQDSISIESFVSVVGLTQSASLEQMFGDQVKNLEGIMRLVDEFEKKYQDATSYGSWYEFEFSQESFDLLSTFIDLKSAVMSEAIKEERDGVYKISGSAVLGLLEFCVNEKKLIEENKIRIEAELVELKLENVKLKSDDLFGFLPLRYHERVSIDDSGYVNLESLIDDIQIQDELVNLNQFIEQLSTIARPIEAYKSQKLMFQSMIYNVRMADMIKPFEDVINNEDFGKRENGKILLNENQYKSFENGLYWLEFEIDSTKIEKKNGQIIIDEEYFKKSIGSINDLIMGNAMETYAVDGLLGIEYKDLNKILELINGEGDFKYLTDTQKDIYLYHLNKYKVEKANSYIKALSDQINRLKGLESTYEYLNYLATNGLDFGDNINLYFKGVFDGVGSIFEGVGNIIATDGIRSESDYAKMYLMQILDKSTYTQENLDILRKTNESTEQENQEFEKLVDLSIRLGDDFWRDLSQHSYQVGSAVGYMVLPVLLNLALPGTGSALLFASSMGNAVEQSNQTLGRLSWQSYVYGAATAFAEVAMEKLGGLPGFGNASKGFFKSILSEGMQEFFQTFLNGAIDSAHFKTEYDLVELGPEAFKSAIYGILTAGIMQGPGAMFTLAIKTKNGIKNVKYTFSEALAHLETLGQDILSPTFGIVAPGFEISTSSGNVEVDTVLNLINNGLKYSAIDSMKKLSIEQRAILINAINLNIEDQTLRDSLINDAIKTSKIEDVSKVMELSQKLMLETTNAKNTSKAINIIESLIQSNPELILKLENTYENQTLSKEEYRATLEQIKKYFIDNGMESLIENYENGQKTGKDYDFFLGFEEHTFVHIFRVAIESVKVAPTIIESIQRLSADGKIDFNVSGIDEQTLFLSGIAHDLGMTIENAVYFELDNKPENERDGSGKYTSILDSDLKPFKKGTTTRKNHPLNSALEVMRNTEVFSKNIEVISLLALLHSKSTSGVKTGLSSEAQLSKAIDKLYKYKLQNPEFNFDFSKIVEMNDDNSTPIIEIGKEDIEYPDEKIVTVDYNIFKIKPEIMQELIIGAIALRIGDAHALKTGNNQAGKVIDILQTISYNSDSYSQMLANVNSLPNIKEGTPEFIKAIAMEEAKYSAVNIQEFNDDGSAKAVTDLTALMIITGERNVNQPLTKLSTDHGGLEYVYTIRNNENVYSTWINGVHEKFGEYKSFDFIPQTVVVNIPSDASLELQQLYKDFAHVSENATNPPNANQPGGPEGWFNIKIFMDGKQIYGKGI